MYFILIEKFIIILIIINVRRWFIMSKIKFGVTINASPDMLHRSDYESIKKIAQECETLGYDSIWAMDHLMWGTFNEGSVFEAWTLLSALAVETKSIKLGPLVA